MRAEAYCDATNGGGGWLVQSRGDKIDPLTLSEHG